MKRRLPGIGLLGALCLARPGLADPLDVWNARFSFTGVQAIAYGNGAFVAVGGAETLLVSPDGVTWTRYVSPPALNYEGIIFAGGQFVAYGYPSSTNSLGPRYILFSADGLSWTNVYQTSFQIRAAAYGNNRLVLVGDTLISATVSPLAWSEFQPPGVPLYGVTYGMGRFAAGGPIDTSVYSHGYILSSADGVVWRYDYGPIQGQSVSGISYANGMFVASWRTNASYTSGFLVATNLANWNSSVIITNGSASSSDIGSVVFGGGQFIASLDHKTYTSTDGLAWVNRSGAAGATAFAYGRGTFVAATYTNIKQSDAFVLSSNTPSSNLAIASYAGVTISGTGGVTYRIEYATNLGQGSVWALITNLTLPFSPYLWIDTTSPIPTRRFYRAVQID